MLPPYLESNPPMACLAARLGSVAVGAFKLSVRKSRDGRQCFVFIRGAIKNPGIVEIMNEWSKTLFYIYRVSATCIFTW